MTITFDALDRFQENKGWQSHRQWVICWNQMQNGSIVTMETITFWITNAGKCLFGFNHSTFAVKTKFFQKGRTYFNVKGQLQRFDKLNLFDRFRYVKIVSILIFENSFSFSCYKPSKFWNGSSDDFFEKGRENMCSSTPQKARAWAVTSLEIKININSSSRRKILYISCKVHLTLDENDCTVRSRPKGTIF